MKRPDSRSWYAGVAAIIFAVANNLPHLMRFLDLRRFVYRSAAKKLTLVVLGSLICGLPAVLDVHAQHDEKALEAPIPQIAINLVIESRRLVERDRFTQATLALKRAIAIAPNYVNAHAEYVRLQADFLDRSDLVRNEYETLMRKEPDNPVYPMSLALGLIRVSDTSEKAWLQKVVDVAPRWSWTNCARGLLLSAKDPEASVAELKKYVETEGSWNPAYSTLAYIQSNALKKKDDGIATAERLAALPNASSWDFSLLWKLRLGKASGTPEAKSELRNELNRVLATSRDIKKLDAARLAYAELLDDKNRSAEVADKIRRIDPTWYPERGKVTYVSARNVSGIGRLIVVANRQLANFNKIEEVLEETGPESKILALERLLFSLKLSSELKRIVHERIFEAAAEIKSVPSLLKYGEILFAADRYDVAIPSTIAIILADTKRSEAALRYASIAQNATQAFPLSVPRPANNRLTDYEWNNVRFSEEQRLRFSRRMRSRALDALGWSKFKAGNIEVAKTFLEASLELERVERNLSHLSKILAGLGQIAKAAEIAKEANELYSNSLKRMLTNEPAKDFELDTIDGRKVRLSDLRGKIVMIDFWATWCAPCIQSVPTLVRLYEKYGKQGFEVLYVSGDSETEKYKVAPFAKAKNINFPVMLEAGLLKTYDIKVFPTTIFIDRNGNIRHRDVGFIADESPRKLETIIELLFESDR